MRAVSKTFKWEAAHRLVRYPGLCSHAHGHSFQATVVMQLDQKKQLNSYGFVKDYNAMKLLKEWIDKNWDHATLVSNNDYTWEKWLKENKQRYYVIKHNPTAEKLAEHLFHVARNLLDDQRSRVTEVRVNETCTSEAIYRE